MLTMLGSGPGLQFYNGQFLARSHPATRQRRILEPQGLPNAPNEPGFPVARSCVPASSTAPRSSTGWKPE